MLVSVIVPVYNTARYLPDCLDSILAQSVSDLEVLCLDDCSTDDSLNVLRSYAVRDARVRVIPLETRLSTGTVRNQGLDFARGTYVAFLDSDDLYPEATTLEKLVQGVEQSGFAVSGGYAVYFAKDDFSNWRSAQPAIGFSGRKGIVDFREWQNPRGFCTCLYRRAFLNENNLRFPPITRNEDPVFFATVLLKARQFYAIDSCVYLYRTSYKTVDWCADNYRLKREHVKGLLVLMRLARENHLQKLESRMAREIAGAIESPACFKALADVMKEAIAYMKTSRVLSLDDWLYVFRWMAREQVKAVRIFFAIRHFGLVFVSFKLLNYWKRKYLWRLRRCESSQH